MKSKHELVLGAALGLGISLAGTYFLLHNRPQESSIHIVRTPEEIRQALGEEGRYDSQPQSKTAQQISPASLEAQVQSQSTYTEKEVDIYKTFREHFLSPSINERYTFKGFAQIVDYHLAAGKEITIGELRSLRENKELRPQLAELFGNDENFLKYVDSFGVALDKETLGQYLEQLHLQPPADTEKLANELWIKQGKDIWKEYSQQAFLPHALANIPAYQGNNQVIHEHLTLEQIMTPLVALHEGGSNIRFSSEQKKALQQALRAYDAAAQNLKKITPEDYERDPTSYDQQRQALNMLEGKVSQALMPCGELGIFNQVAARFDSHLGNLFRVGYYKNVLKK